MTKEDFEKQLLEDILTGKVEENVYLYIHNNLSILQQHKDYFRQYFLNDPYSAYWYARDIDKYPRDDTRQAACKDPYYAYCYAYYVDKGPREDTRLAACKDPPYAYYYALDVDKCFNEDTFNSVKGSFRKKYYLKYLGKPC